MIERLKNKLSLSKFIVIIFIVIGPSTTFAAGIQVSPSTLDFTISTKDPQTKSIVIVNPTADVQVFEVYADEFTEAIKAQPESFTLESGARKTVTISVSAEKLEGQLSTNLSVVGKPLADGKLSVGTGVKIPLTVVVSEQTKNLALLNWLGAGAAILGLLLAGYLSFKRKAIA